MLRIAYLNSRYPSVSHSFIEREIRELRRRGVQIETFSINAPRPQDLLGERNQEEGRQTFVLKSSVARLIALQLRAVLRWRFAYLRAAWQAQRLFPPGLRSRLKSLGYLFEAARLAAELERRGHEHVHVHMANNGAAVAMLACALNPRLSYSLSIHGSAEFFDVERLNLAVKCQRAVFVRCISDFCRAQIMAWTAPENWARYHVVHCAVDTQQFQPPQQHDAREGRSPDQGPQGAAQSSTRAAEQARPLRLISVGRLEPIKGYPLLLESLSVLLRKGVQFRLELVGSGVLEAALAARIESLRLREHVRLLGAMAPEDLPAALARNEVLIVSSFMEGIPVVLMEAMAMGLMVISTSVGGISELVTHRKNGLLVRPGSKDALAEAIAELAQRRSDCDAMRRAARETIVGEFCLSGLGEGMHTLFKRYLAPQPAGVAKDSV